MNEIFWTAFEKEAAKLLRKKKPLRRLKRQLAVKSERAVRKAGTPAARITAGVALGVSPMAGEAIRQHREPAPQVTTDPETFKHKHRGEIMRRAMKRELTPHELSQLGWRNLDPKKGIVWKTPKETPEQKRRKEWKEKREAKKFSRVHHDFMAWHRKQSYIPKGIHEKPDWWRRAHMKHLRQTTQTRTPPKLLSPRGGPYKPGDLTKIRNLPAYKAARGDR